MFSGQKVPELILMLSVATQGQGSWPHALATSVPDPKRNPKQKQGQGALMRAPPTTHVSQHALQTRGRHPRDLPRWRRREKKRARRDWHCPSLGPQGTRNCALGRRGGQGAPPFGDNDSSVRKPCSPLPLRTSMVSPPSLKARAFHAFPPPSPTRIYSFMYAPVARCSRPDPLTRMKRRGALGNITGDGTGTGTASARQSQASGNELQAENCASVHAWDTRGETSTGSHEPFRSQTCD